MTAAPLSAKKVAFRRDTQSGGLVVNCLEKPSRESVRFAAFDGDCALPRSRQHLLDDRNVQARRDELMAEAVEPCLGQQQPMKRRVCGKFAQAGRHIAANFNNPKVLAQEQDLHLPARA